MSIIEWSDIPSGLGETTMAKSLSNETNNLDRHHYLAARVFMPLLFAGSNLVPACNAVGDPIIVGAEKKPCTDILLPVILGAGNPSTITLECKTEAKPTGNLAFELFGFIPMNRWHCSTGRHLVESEEALNLRNGIAAFRSGILSPSIKPGLLLSRDLPPYHYTAYFSLVTRRYYLFHTATLQVLLVSAAKGKELEFYSTRNDNKPGPDEWITAGVLVKEADILGKYSGALIYEPKTFSEEAELDWIVNRSV
jgi:hypothetical protein